MAAYGDNRMIIDVREVLRYLGYSRNKPDEATLELIDGCVKELQSEAQPRHTYRRFELEVSDGGWIRAGGIEMISHNLARNLTGCNEVIFFAATLGNAPDILMNRYSRLSISRAAVMQAVAAAATESYCNECQRAIEDSLAAEQIYVRPRFSPGYGDLPLGVQADFLRVLDARKTVGIYLSDGGVMMPEKSVTAVMGLSRENSRCHIEGCEACGKTNCAYRR